MADPTSISKVALSASVDGRGVKIVATASSGTTIHTAQSGNGDNNYDEVWMWAYNSGTADIEITIQFGGTATPDDDIVVTIPFDAGLVPVLAGLVLQNSLIVRAYAVGNANLVMLHGFVNRIAA